MPAKAGKMTGPSSSSAAAVALSTTTAKKGSAAAAAAMPATREVATGIANLGNTCYMNAVLQALAHAPELCLAMECEPHQVGCPVARSNEVKRRERRDKEEEEAKKKAEAAAKDEGGGTMTTSAADKADLAGEEAKKAAANVGDAPPATAAANVGDAPPATAAAVVAIEQAAAQAATKGAKKGRGGRRGGRKGGGSSRSVSPNPAGAGGRAAAAAAAQQNGLDSAAAAAADADEFCVLCEVEKHMGRVHVVGDRVQGGGGGQPSSSAAAVAATTAASGGGAQGTQQQASGPSPSSGGAGGGGPDAPASGAVAPSAFVHGFIEHVAPWFKLGVQEDSHEFLRLLIDAMQKSCAKARKGAKGGEEEGKKDVGKGADDVPMMKDEEEVEEKQLEKGGGAGNNNSADDKGEGGNKVEDSEYPFQLFRGTVESNVQCSSCDAVSSKLDPIEDIGLEVTYAPHPGLGGRSSPTPGALADVDRSLQRFVRSEQLDSGYKCEKCGKVGRATKTSKLASIPPILTLHLKRFRYGAAGGDGVGGTLFPAGIGGVGGAVGTSSRRGRSTELGQLSAAVGGGAHGASGSAKIEGHIKFKEFFDIRPFLTAELQARHKSMFCRLFAVIVHAGKNSHSGHYIAYVRNVAKNEWWKMDDARVSRVATQEVTAAEAYMLFYRVVNHPVSKRLEKAAQARAEEAAKAAAAAKKEGEAKDAESNAVDKKDGDAAEVSEVRSALGKRKLDTPEFKTGEEWARAKTRILPSAVSSLRSADEVISESVEFKAEYFRLIVDEANSGGVTGPSGVSADNDIQGGTEKYRLAILKLLHKLATSDVAGSSGEADGFFLPEAALNTEIPSNQFAGQILSADGNVKTLIVPVMETSDVFL